MVQNFGSQPENGPDDAAGDSTVSEHSNSPVQSLSPLFGSHDSLHFVPVASVASQLPAPGADDPEKVRAE